MVAAAVRGYLADVLQGRRSLLVVRAEAMAKELSAQIRAELVAAGRVSAEVLGRDQRRQPRRRRRPDPGPPQRLHPAGPRRAARSPTARSTRSIGRNRLTGTLTVRDRDGILAHLPAAYVKQHTTLAYAVTSYGAQGQTVYSSHSLVDQGTTRAGVYVPGTRGTDANTFYVICQHAPDHHDPERIDRTPVAVLTDILTRPVDRNTAAEIARRAGADETRSLAWVGTQWDLLTAEYGRHRATDTLTRLLPADVAAASGRRARLRPADGRGAVHGAGRARPARGTHRSRRARQPARRALRLRRAALPHPAARQRRPRSRTGGARRGLDHLRRTVGRARSATTPRCSPRPRPHGRPNSANAPRRTRRRGRSPRRPSARPRPTRCSAPSGCAAPASSRPTATCTPSPRRSCPSVQAPSRERAFHHALWRQALTALGHPADALDYATASDAELREMRDAWRRAQAWAPQFVAADLHTARELRRGVPPRRRHLAGRAGPPPGRQPGTRAGRTRPGRGRAPRRRLRRPGRGPRAHPGRPHRLARPQPRTAGARRLRRRRTRTPRPGPRHRRPHRRAAGTVQPSARREPATDEPRAGADADATPAAPMRGLDPAQQQFDLDEVPRAVPAAAPTGARHRAHDRRDHRAPSASRGVTTGPDDAQRNAADSAPAVPPRAGRPTSADSATGRLRRAVRRGRTCGRTRT